jgi:hypothetical protein
MEYALVRSRPAAKRTRWAFTSANSARGRASAKVVQLRQGMVVATLCIRRYVSGSSRYRARAQVRPRSALHKGLGTRESATGSGARTQEMA